MTDRREPRTRVTVGQHEQRSLRHHQAERIHAEVPQRRGDATHDAPGLWPSWAIKPDRIFRKMADKDVFRPGRAPDGLLHGRGRRRGIRGSPPENGPSTCSF
ncbi:MAG: hypothetical protein M0C28_39080 [Candidatus Moduliflexus flocculans]|nr:hypothetical protein [Candidatus Moduliflexus flocculans]